MTRSKGGNISNGLLLGSFMSSGGASGVICLPDDTSTACNVKRAAAVIQSILTMIIIFALVAWAFFHRKKLYKAIRY
jgi:hypothetical protein